MHEHEDYQGRTVIDQNGEKIGTVSQLYEDTDTGKAEWGLVKTGLFGTSETFVPLFDVRPEGDALRIPFAKAQVKDAPRVEAAGELAPDEEDRLYRHYGLNRSTASSGSGLPSGGQGDIGGHVRPPSDLKRRSLPLHEEELRARKQRVETGEVRLGKEVVTEHRAIDVPVTREQVVVERRAVEGRPAPDAKIGEGELRVPVSEERVEVDKQVRVREEVSLGTKEVQETEHVEGEVRREEARVERKGSADGPEKKDDR